MRRPYRSLRGGAAARFARVRSALLLALLGVACLTALSGTFAAAAGASPTTAYVVNEASDSVTPIELATDAPGEEIKVGKAPFGIAITPDGKIAYVANAFSNSVTPIELATNKAGAAITVEIGRAHV